MFNGEIRNIKNIEKLVNNDNFKEINQFHKRKLVGDFILTKEHCKDGIDVLCYDLETYVNPKNMYFYNKGTVNHIRNMTIGKYYRVDKYDGENKIKITNDIGHSHWYQLKRFIYNLKIERRDKLKKINKHENK